MADRADDERLLLLLLLFILIRRRRRLQRNQGRRRLWVRGVFLKMKSQGEFGNLVRELRTSNRELYFRGTVSQPLPVFPQEPPFFFLTLSLKGTGNEFFDWLIIPLPLPTPFTLFSLDRKRRKRKRNRKKKKLF